MTMHDLLALQGLKLVLSRLDNDFSERILPSEGKE